MFRSGLCLLSLSVSRSRHPESVPAEGFETGIYGSAVGLFSDAMQESDRTQAVRSKYATVAQGLAMAESLVMDGDGDDGMLRMMLMWMMWMLMWMMMKMIMRTITWTMMLRCRCPRRRRLFSTAAVTAAD